MSMIEVVLDDRLGKKIRVKCNSDDTVGELKVSGMRCVYMCCQPSIQVENPFCLYANPLLDSCSPPKQGTGLRR